MVDLYAALQPIVDEIEMASGQKKKKLQELQELNDDMMYSASRPKRPREDSFGGWIGSTRNTADPFASEDTAASLPTSDDSSQSDAPEFEFPMYASSLEGEDVNFPGDESSTCTSAESDVYTSADDESFGSLPDSIEGEEHEDDGCDDIAASYAQDTSDDAEIDEPNLDEPIKLALMGLPNVGKSTMFNHLMGFERVMTGPERGLTRDAVTSTFLWKERKFEITDTAGA